MSSEGLFYTKIRGFEFAKKAIIFSSILRPGM